MVEGSVRQSGGRVKVTAQVIETKRGHHLWSGSFERTSGDVLQLQDEIARTISRELAGSLGLKASAVTPDTTNVEAYHAYLRGRFFGSQQQSLKMLREFQRAVALDPQYASAHGGIANAYLQERTAGGATCNGCFGMRGARLNLGCV